MLVQLLTGGPPVRVESTQRTTHNGRPCLLVRGLEFSAPGVCERIEVYISESHPITLWPDNVRPVLAN